MTNTQEIVWGDPIAVDGKRPGFVRDEDAIDVRSDWVPKWYSDASGGNVISFSNIDWSQVAVLRLPADHPHYRQPAPIDWSGELEAVHEDGRVVPVTYEKPQGFKARHWISGIAPEEQDEPVLFNSDGTHAYDSGWRIRNVTPQPTPQADTKPDVTARMIAEFRELASVNPDGVGVYFASNWVKRARAIVALLPEPVDPEYERAEKLLTELWYEEDRFGAIVKFAAEQVARGRELALAGETGK